MDFLLDNYWLFFVFIYIKLYFLYEVLFYLHIKKIFLIRSFVFGSWKSCFFANNFGRVNVCSLRCTSKLLQRMSVFGNTTCLESKISNSKIERSVRDTLIKECKQLRINALLSPDFPITTTSVFDHLDPILSTICYRAHLFKIFLLSRCRSYFIKTYD